MLDAKLYLLVPNLTVSTLSILGTSVLIFLQKRLASIGSKREWRRLIFYLSICDLVHSIFYCVQWASPIVDEYVCFLISILGIASFSCAAFWTAAIAHHLHKSVTRYTTDTGTDGKEPPKNERSSLFYYHIVCWGYPWITISSIIFVNFLYHKVIVRCEDSECFGCFFDQKDFYFRMIAIYLPLWGSWLYVVGKYICIYRKSQATHFRRRLILIPMIYVFTRVPETIFRIYEYSVTTSISDDDPVIVVLNVLQAICNPLQGFLNFVFFAFDKSSKETYLQCCRSSEDPSCTSQLLCCLDCSFWLPLQPAVKWSKFNGVIGSADPLLPNSSLNLTIDHSQDRSPDSDIQYFLPPTISQPAQQTRDDNEDDDEDENNNNNNPHNTNDTSSQTPTPHQSPIEDIDYHIERDEKMNLIRDHSDISIIQGEEENISPKEKEGSLELSQRSQLLNQT